MELCVNVVISILMWFVIGASVIQVWIKGGGTYQTNKWTTWLLNKKVNYEGEETTARECAQIAFMALAIRILIYVGAGIIMILFIQDKSTRFTLDTYLNNWMKWDACHYLGLAEKGYSGYIENGQPLFLVFFPLYPILISLVHKVISDIRLAALIVSTICFMVGCVYLYCLTAERYNKQIAYNAILLLGISPFSFYFGGIMTESTYFMCVAGCLYYIHKKNIVGIIVSGFLASLSRMQGIVLVIPLVIVWWEYDKPIQQIREKKWLEALKDAKRLVLSTAGIVGGIGSYLLLNYKVSGNPLMFLTYEKEHWYQSSQYFGKTLGNIFGWASGGLEDMNYEMKWSIWWPSLITFLIVMCLLIYGLNRHEEQYILYAAACTVMNYSLTWLMSACRYMTTVIPIFIILAECIEHHKKGERWVMIVSSLFLAIYLTAYLMNKIVM